MSNTQFEQKPETVSSLGKTGSFVQENSKSLMVIGGTIVGLILLFFAYQKFYLAPRETEAIDQMYKAQQYWENKEWDKAIKGLTSKKMAKVEKLDEVLTVKLQ